MPKRSASPAPDAAHAAHADSLSLAEQLLARADALFRIAAETCRQHRRYACLVDHAVAEPELRSALRLATFCDAMLVEAIEAYEKCSSKAAGNGANGGVAPAGEVDDWRHRANALWMAAREYERRHQVSDRASRLLNAQHDPATLRELTLEYDLETSALLFLQQSIDGYRKTRPEADLH